MVGHAVSTKHFRQKWIVPTHVRLTETTTTNANEETRRIFHNAQLRFVWFEDALDFAASIRVLRVQNLPLVETRHGASLTPSVAQRA